jgi:hypothetical protein
MLASVCFHNLVTYAQRLQDLYSACLMFWVYVCVFVCMKTTSSKQGIFSCSINLIKIFTVRDTAQVFFFFLMSSSKYGHWKFGKCKRLFFEMCTEEKIR